MVESRRSTNTSTLPLKVIANPIFITGYEEDIKLKQGCQFNKDIKMVGCSGTILCPQQVFFYGQLIFHNCEYHIICEGDPNIFNKVILQNSILTLEGVSAGYADQLSDDVLILRQSKIYS